MTTPEARQKDMGLDRVYAGLISSAVSPGFSDIFAQVLQGIKCDYDLSNEDMLDPQVWDIVRGLPDGSVLVTLRGVLVARVFLFFDESRLVWSTGFTRYNRCP